jgi:XTP/dITP diphosphohydrolase
MTAGGTVVLATRNPGKLRELGRILGGSGARIRLAGLGQFPGAPDAPETGATFEENALAKARAIAAATGLPAVADDSGLCVDALRGMPGVLSARWAGRHGDDKANLDLVLAQVADVPGSRLGARFVCAAALVVPGRRPDAPDPGRPAPDPGRPAPDPGRPAPHPGRPAPHPGRPVPDPGRPDLPAREWVVTGQLDGRLVREPRGSGGFGYDPVFLPDGCQLTTAEMTPEAKDAISHRGRAFRALLPFITALFEDPGGGP